MDTVYTETAINCPPLQLGADLTAVDPTDDPPVLNLYEEILVGATTPASVGVLRINQNSARNEGSGRFPVGARAVSYGFLIDISSGLTASYTAGAICADGYQNFAAGTLAIAPSVYAWMYATQGGTVSAVTRAVGSGTSSPPSLPAGSVFLGRVLTDGSSILQIDGSGVFRYPEGGILLRRTADLGKPTDTPDADSRYYTKTAAGVYLWDGAEYQGQRDALALSRSTIPAGDAFTIPTGWQSLVYGDFVVEGELIVEGEILQLEAVL